MKIDGTEDNEIARMTTQRIGVPGVFTGEISRKEIDHGHYLPGLSMNKRLEYDIDWVSDLGVMELVDKLAELEESRDSSLSKPDAYRGLLDRKARAVVDAPESSYSYDTFMTELRDIISDDNYPENISMLGISGFDNEVVWREEIDAIDMIDMYTDRAQISFGASLNQNIRKRHGEYEIRKVIGNENLNRFEDLISETFHYQSLEGMDEIEDKNPEQILDNVVEEIRIKISEEVDGFFLNEGDSISRLEARTVNQK